MREFVGTTKALSDPQRVRLLLALRGGELCVCQLVELLKLAGSTVSKHLSILQQAGLVESRKEERWVYYRLPGKRQASPMVRQALDWTFKSTEQAPETKHDQERLEHILKTDPKILCQRQTRK